MRNTWFAFIAVCLSLSGCNGCDGDHPPGNTDMAVADLSMPDDLTIPDDAQKLVTFTQFSMDFAKALCDHYLACGQLDQAQMDACISRNLRYIGWDEDVEIMKGRVSLNELQCLDAVKNARCDSSDSAAWNSRCAQFLQVPHQANGQPCLAGVECTSGFCMHSGSDAGAAGVMQVTGCPGTCQPVLSVGDPCRLDGDCGAQAYCDIFTTQKCQPLPALNDVCAGFCQFGLLCPTFPSMGDRCVAPMMQTQLDGACDPLQGASTPTPPCGPTMYCQVQFDSGGNETGGKCKLRIAANMPCDPKNEGKVFAGTTMGQYWYAGSQCADGTLCYSTSGVAGSETCHALGGDGADCNSLGGTVSTCKHGLYCDAATLTTPGKCHTYVMNGAACAAASAETCPSALPGQSTCIDDTMVGGTNYTCQQARGFGAACKPGIEDALCAASDNAGSAYCAPTGGGNGACAPRCF